VSFIVTGISKLILPVSGTTTGAATLFEFVFWAWAANEKQNKPVIIRKERIGFILKRTFVILKQDDLYF
jgi:hypothetical protein